MKKFICFLLVVLMATAFAACSNDDNDTSEPDESIDILATNSILESTEYEQLSSEDSGNSVSSDEDFIGIDTEKGYYIDEYIGDAKIVKIPEELDGNKVVGIERDAFYNYNNFEEIIFSSGITEIEDFTFSGVYSLKRAVLNEGLERIGERAFISCENMSEIVIPSTLKSIGNFAFCECKSLKSVELPEGLTEIGYTVFGNCLFETISFPSTVTLIDQSVVDNCSNLKAMYILGVDTEINDYAVSNCPNVVVYGYSGSTAESFAQNRELEFVAIQ